MSSYQSTAPSHLVELGSERFDPGESGRRARRRATAGKKRLAQSLGVAPAAIPGTDREPYLVQLKTEPDPGTIERLRREHRLTLAHGMGGLTLLERLTRAAVASLRHDRAVRSCIPYWPDLKLAPGASKTRRIELGLVDGDDVDAVSSLLERLGVQIVRVNDDREAGASLSILAEPGAGVDLLAVAAIDDIAWIVPVGEAAAHNLDVASVAQGGAGEDHPIWDHGLHGENMIIGVIDFDEIDLRSRFFRDSDHTDAGADHRKVLQIREANEKLPVDDHRRRHGMRVSGSAVADDEADEGGHPHRGGAWAARITYGDALAFLGSSPTASLIQEFDAARAAGATMLNNSWAYVYVDAQAHHSYDNFAADADAYLWKQEKLLCVQSAMNPGDDTRFVNGRRVRVVAGALQIAKNAIVVGGVHEPPNHDRRRRDPWPLTGDGRRKPDLLGVAEGITTSDLTNDGEDPLAVAEGRKGNSYAAAHVSAAAALVRQYFTERWYPTGRRHANHPLSHLFSNPSGALLKAMLLNATVPLAEGKYPEDGEGWGRLKLDETLFFDGDERLLRVWDVPHAQGFDASDAHHERAQQVPLTVPVGATQMKLTLVFNDPAERPDQPDPVVNKLYLVAHEPVKNRWDIGPAFGFFSNDFDDNGLSKKTNVLRLEGWSYPVPDELKNNVHQIVVQNPVPGRWFLAVVPHTVISLRPPPLFGRTAQGWALVTRVDLS